MSCSAPDRICKCCATGKPCAHELQLDVRQEKQLARILAIVGEQPHYHSSRYTKTQQRAGYELVEPVTTLECDDCGRTSELFTYLHDFLVSNHVRLPPCPVCAADRRAA